MYRGSIEKWEAVIADQERDHNRAITKQEATVDGLYTRVSKAKEELRKANAALDEAIDDLEGLCSP